MSSFYSEMHDWVYRECELCGDLDQCSSEMKDVPNFRCYDCRKEGKQEEDRA